MPNPQQPSRTTTAVVHRTRKQRRGASSPGQRQVTLRSAPRSTVCHHARRRHPGTTGAVARTRKREKEEKQKKEKLSHAPCKALLSL